MTVARKISSTDECCPSVLSDTVTSDDVEDLVRGFSALADPVRLRILNILAASDSGEVCVCELVSQVPKSQSTISHHLKILSDSGLVSGERRTKWVWYSLNRDRLDRLRRTLSPT
jgi:ArsR family transcriptional regulator